MSRLFEQNQFPLKITAQEDCDILVLDLKQFYHLIENHSECRMNFCKNFIDKVRQDFLRKTDQEKFGYSTYFDCI
ncbi:hypothetical protein ASG01_14405 [Chryseobacterium sp. Leaf180]|nr:hypothetical protein ASG01_14405 [Chryseobacterium sp. Leaf180]